MRILNLLWIVTLIALLASDAARIVTTAFPDVDAGWISWHVTQLDSGTYMGGVVRGLLLWVGWSCLRDALAWRRHDRWERSWSKRLESAMGQMRARR